MARPISDEELQLRKRARRRLIGAIVLVTAVAVALPMVLDSEPRPAGQEINIRIPSPDSGAFTSKIAQPKPAARPSPATEKPDARPPAPESQALPPASRPPQAAEKSDPGPVTPSPLPPAVEAKPAPVAVLKEAARPEEKPAAAKAPATPALKETVAKADGGQFVVQVVALNDAAKAKQIRQQISDTGIKSYTEVIKTVKGDVTRVRAGPFATRGAAEKAQKQLAAIGLNGKIVPK